MNELDSDTWRELDPTWDAWAVARGWPPEPISAELWLEWVTAVRLRAEAPDEIRRLFAVAQAAIAYGALHYPLMALGVEQLWRIAETLVRNKARQVSGRPSPSFTSAIAILMADGCLTEKERMQLEATRNLRNSASHPTLQQILTPADALRELASVVSWEERLSRPPADAGGAA